MAHGPVPASVWDEIRKEFGLPHQDLVRHRLSGLVEDPEPIMRQLVRVFVDAGTCCPGFQFTSKGQLRPGVTSLFRRAMELRIAHNHFSAWMVTPSRQLNGARPVDVLDGDPSRLLHAMESFGPG